MKNFLITLALIITIGLGVSQAQTYTDSWAFGFGGTYPRLVSVNVQPLNSNYGAFLSLQRNFSENVGLRLKVSYLHLEGKISPATDDLDKVVTNLLKGDLDVLYYVNPCEPISPYVFAGGSVGLRMLRENYATRYLDENETALALNLGIGVEWTIAPQWKVLSEYGYHTLFNSELDGTIAPIPEEINGRDSYMTLNLGLLYYFGRGEPSKKCDPCRGLSMEMKDMTDYNRIENMIKQHIPKEVIKEVIVDKYIYAISEDRLVLVGVNFAFDKSDLLPESYTVLDKAVKLLNDKPNVNVEIEGYTDYIGTAEYNQTLSVERAQTVKDYLVFKGIAERRLSTIGYGKGNPVADNETEEGRAMNRRIVFRILK